MKKFWFYAEDSLKKEISPWLRGELVLPRLKMLGMTLI